MQTVQTPQQQGRPKHQRANSTSVLINSPLTHRSGPVRFLRKLCPTWTAP